MIGHQLPSLFHLLVWANFICSAICANLATFMNQAFFFDWNPVGQLYPVPVTSQCETLHITWSRAAATGPNNVGPYYLQIYTSIYTFPLIISTGDVLTFDWTVPFPPGTLYQICMFDKNGNTGGCQAVYTVIKPQNGTSCQNITYPSTILDVEATVVNGPSARYGWIPQCTDLSVTPKNGTPPYVFTIAPSLHPPANITSNTQGAVNWTVSLSWGSPFFVSVVDSKGNSWANGLLHSGEGDSSCLSLNAVKNRVTIPMMIGSIVGAATTGGLLAVLATYLFIRFRARSGTLGNSQVNHDEHHDLTAGNGSYYQGSSNQSSGYIGRGQSSYTHHAPGLASGEHLGYHIEPFTPFSEDLQPSFDPQSPSIPDASTSTQPSVAASDSALSDLPPRYIDSFPSWRHPRSRSRKGSAPAVGQSHIS